MKKQLTLINKQVGRIPKKDPNTNNDREYSPEAAAAAAGPSGLVDVKYDDKAEIKFQVDTKTFDRNFHRKLLVVEPFTGKDYQRIKKDKRLNKLMDGEFRVGSFSLGQKLSLAAFIIEE